MSSEDIPQSGKEELANGLSAGLGLLLSAAALVVLVDAAAGQSGILPLVAFLGFGLSMVAVYLSSSLYHLAKRKGLKERLRQLDHAAIYLLIAGTYTPFTLLNLHGTFWGWLMFAAIWVLATTGIAIKLLAIDKLAKLSTATYLGMGWLVVIAIKPAIAAIPSAGLGWLVAGGIAYSVGVIFYVTKRVPFSHAIWHGFVVTGSACHATAVVGYAGYAS